MKSVVVIIAAVATYFNLQVVEGGPYTISDERVRSLDITPVLGRGYSIGTNSFQSTCLMVDEVTSPSYNYDYNFKDYSKNSESEISAAATAEASFSASIISGEASSSASVDTKSTSQMRMITASMKIQRYYSSVREELSPLSEDALTLLDSQDYIGFFKSCGPNYVRSIRRAQELTAIFKFSASSTSVATEFAASIKGEGAGRSISTKVSGNSKFSSAKSSLKIIILGFGLGLNNEGSSTLVSTSLEEYNEVMKFGFISFTQSEDSHNIGMVYGIEIVPWVDNTAFQVASKLLDEEVEIALPRSLIPKALLSDGTVSGPGVFANDAAGREAHRCKEGIHHIDKYGYCCEISSLFNTNTQEYTQEAQDIAVSANVCMPVRKLDKSVVKNNMSNNGEFVAHLDSIVRYRLNQIFTLEKCLTSINSYDSTYDMYILKAQDSVKYDATIEAKYTVLDLKMALDPGKDYGLLQSLGNELDEFVEMYYSPCIAALFGTNIGSNPDVEPQYFLAYGWLTHDACAHLSCLADNMRWDRRVGGCTAGTITGSAIPYGADDTDVNHCAKDDNPLFSGEERCKHPEAELKVFQDKANGCWSDTVPYYIMNHFCMPQLTGNLADPFLMGEVIARRSVCLAHEAAAPATPVAAPASRRLLLN